MKNFKETMNRVAELYESHGIKTKGNKTYTQVVHRMQAFREFHGLEYGVDTRIVLDDGIRVVMKAIVTDREGQVIGSGHAEEIRETQDQRKVNYTSAIENCETSAVGRALASIGLSGGEYASANELDGVDRKTEAKKELQFISESELQELKSLIDQTKADESRMCEHYAIDSLPKLPKAKFVNAKKSLEVKKEQQELEKQNGKHDQTSESSGEGRPSSKDKSEEVLAQLRANMGLERQGESE